MRELAWGAMLCGGVRDKQAIQPHAHVSSFSRFFVGRRLARRNAAALAAMAARSTSTRCLPIDSTARTGRPPKCALATMLLTQLMHLRGWRPHLRTNRTKKSGHWQARPTMAKHAPSVNAHWLRRTGLACARTGPGLTQRHWPAPRPCRLPKPAARGVAPPPWPH